MARRYRRGGAGNFGLLLLAGQIMQIGVERIPPVTLITVVINVLIFMGLIPNMPSVRKACTSYSKVVYKGQWQCLILSSIYHLDDMHLYYNMASFLWKGIKLENKLKSSRFALVLVVFSVLTQVVMIALNYLLYEALSNSSYLHTCAAGFSAVIFALKVLTTKYSDNDVSIMGFPIFVPAKYACWVELIVIQLLVPNASFTGHLAGILVGLLYTHGPLKKIIKAVWKLSTGRYTPSLSRNQSYTYHTGNTGSSRNQAQPSGSRQHMNHSDEDEALQQAIRESLREQRFAANEQQNRPPTYGWNIPSSPQNYNYQDDYLNTNGSRRRNNSNPTAPPLNDDYSSQSQASYNPISPPYPTNNLYPNLDTMPTLEKPLSSERTKPEYETTNSPETEQYNAAKLTSHNDADAIRNARLKRFQKKHL